MQKTTFSWGILALALLSIASGVHAQQKTNRPNNHQFLNIYEDSSTNPPQTIVNYKSDSLYNMILSGGKLTSLFVNGRQVPADSFYVYDGLVRRVKEQMERDRKQAVRDKVQAEKDAQQAVQDKHQAEKDAEQAQRDKHQAEKDAQQALLDKHQAERDAEQLLRDKQQAEKDAEQAVRDKKQAEEDKAMVKNMTAEIVKEGLAPDEKSIESFLLDEKEFTVNGKKQSDEMQKKFSQKFIKRSGSVISVHFGKSSVGRVDK